MAEITVEESWRQIRVLTDRAEQAMSDRRPDEAVDRWRAVLAHPCGHHQVAAYEILDEIHRAFREAGHYDDAIAAKREAIAAGYRSVPDPEADIAECLLDAGRIEEAAALFATLRERDPEEVWLYNAAAYSYAATDVATSLRWALEGIEVALATGDPDQVVVQLLELAEVARQELGEPVDPQLVDRVERFCAELDARARRNRRHLLEAEDPEALARLDALGGPEPAAKLPGPVELAIAWFPADGLKAHAEESGHDPGSGEARASYAATLHQAGGATTWPPGRNEPCWCASGRKYKKCCGPVPAADDTWEVAP